MSVVKDRKGLYYRTINLLVSFISSCQKHSSKLLTERPALNVDKVVVGVILIARRYRPGQGLYDFFCDTS